MLRLGDNAFRVPFLLASLTLVFQLTTADTALAHHPEITAQAVCTSTGEVVINFTATAWDPVAVGWSDATSGDPCLGTNPNGTVIGEGCRANDQIEIYFGGSRRTGVLVDGMLVGTGAFEADAYSFSGTVPAPRGVLPGDFVYVSAEAAAPWGNGHVPREFEYRDTLAYLPTEPCVSLSSSCALDVTNTCVVDPGAQTFQGCLDKVTELTLLYRGTGCNDSINGQKPKKVKCKGGASLAPLVDIVVTNKKGKKVFLNTRSEGHPGVALGDEVILAAAGVPGKRILEEMSLSRSSTTRMESRSSRSSFTHPVPSR